MFARDGERIILAASNDGKDQPPAYFPNLGANRNVEVQIGREHLRGAASAIDASDSEYSRLWELMNQTNNRRHDAISPRPLARSLS